MAKKVYIETVKKWAINTGIGGGTLIGLVFIYLVAVGAISDVSYSGDSICAGTLEDPCYAFINFTANEDIFIYRTDYDPWGRNTLFNFDPNVKSWKLERSWGRGWREIPLNQSCTGTWCGAPTNNADVQYSVVFRENRNYSLRITAYKSDPNQDIKWGAFSGVDEIDPVWFGVDKNLRGKRISYTENSQTICSNGSCSTTIYPETSFVQERGSWVNVEDAASLKGSSISCSVKKDSDSDPNVICDDWNLTTIKFKVLDNPNETEITVRDKDSKIKRNVLRSNLTKESEILVSVDRSEKIHIGENSTILSLDDSFLIYDGHMQEDSAGSSDSLGEIIVSGRVGDEDWSMVMFSLSAVPDNVTIQESKLELNLETNGLDTSTEGYNVTFHRVMPFPLFNVSGLEWDDGITWDERPTIADLEFNATNYSKTFFDGNSATGKYNFTITDIIQDDNQDFKDNSSILIRAYDQLGTPASLDFLTFSQSETGTAGDRPRLHVTYTDPINILRPVENQQILNNLSFVLNVSSSEYNQTMRYTFNNGDTNTTICSDKNDCQIQVTVASRGYYNLSVWGSNAGGEWDNRNVSILVANNSVFDFNNNEIGFYAEDLDQCENNVTSSAPERTCTGGAITDVTNSSNLNAEEGDEVFHSYSANIVDKWIGFYAERNLSDIVSNKSNVIMLNWTLTSRIQTTSETPAGNILHQYNVTGDSWKVCGSTTSNSFVNLSCDISTSDFINDSLYTKFIHVAQATSSSGATSTDFIKLNVTWIGDPLGAPSDSCTPPVSGTWEIQCSDNCVIDSLTNPPGDVEIQGTSGLISIQDTLQINKGNRIYGAAGASCQLFVDESAGGSLVTL